jgi:hypothetical protein
MPAAILALIALLMQPQVPAARPAMLHGRVVRTGSDTPIAHARILAARVGGALADYRTTSTDAGGRFTIRDLAPGTYRVYAERSGYPRTEYGRQPAGSAGTPITLAAGQSSHELVIALMPPGVIAGIVLDDNRPARNVWVRALKSAYVDGERRFNIVEYAQSDDRGEFRLFDLPPGLYFVSAMPPEPPRIEGDSLVTPTIPTNANENRFQLTTPLSPETLDARALSREVYRPTYHPGTIDLALAQPIDVRPGSVTAGVTLTLARTPTYRVRGTVVLTGDIPTTRVQVGLVARQPEMSLSVRSVPADAGTFELTGVPPGHYLVAAQTTATRITGQPIEVVDRDVDGVSIVVQPDVTVTGRVMIDGAPPQGETILVQLQRGQGLPGYSAVRVQPDGSFTIPNVAPFEYRFRVMQSGRVPWIREARLGSTDVLDAPLRITGDVQGQELTIDLGTKTGVIEALVLDRRNRPVAGASVVAVPSPERRNRSTNFRTGTSGVDGRVRIDQIPPGEYLVFASIEIESGAWQDPDVLRLHESRGERVRLLENATSRLTLRITP